MSKAEANATTFRVMSVQMLRRHSWEEASGVSNKRCCYMFPGLNTNGGSFVPSTRFRVKGNMFDRWWLGWLGWRRDIPLPFDICRSWKYQVTSS